MDILAVGVEKGNELNLANSLVGVTQSKTKKRIPEDVIAGLWSRLWQRRPTGRARRGFIRGAKYQQFAASRDCGEGVAVRGETQPPDFLGDARMCAYEWPKHRHFAAKGKVPKSDRVIGAPTGQGLAIGRKRQRPNWTLVPVQGRQAASGFQ